MRFLLLSALFLAACAQSAPPPPQTSVFSPEMRTVLSGDAARTLTHQCSRVSPGPAASVWTPTEADLNALEVRLAPVLETHLRQAAESAAPTDYYLQYAGFVIGGKRMIYVNGLHRDAIERDANPDHPFDWRTQAVQICDGGAITFGVEYYPDNGEFSRFAFNGAL